MLKRSVLLRSPELAQQLAHFGVIALRIARRKFEILFIGRDGLRKMP
jgi:hypothetical protein